jgi:hypothetical protein
VDSPIKKTRDALQKDLDEIRKNKKDRAEAKTDRVFLLTKEEEIESRNRFISHGFEGQIKYLQSIYKYHE